MSDTAASDPRMAALEAELSEVLDSIDADLALTAVDLAGIVDPTPISDAIGMGASLYQGDVFGAGLSVLSMVPYLGDAIGKSAKLARAAARLKKAVDKVKGLLAEMETVSKATSAVAERAKKLLDRVKKLLGKADEAAEAKGCKQCKDSGKSNDKQVKGEKSKEESSSGGKNGDDAAEPKTKQDQIRENAKAGRRRELETEQDLKQQYPDADVQREQFLRNSDGKVAKDPLTGEARRIDHVVIKDGQVIDSVETTSLTADKTLQIAKENRIREAGGTFIRDRGSGNLVDASQTATREVRRP